MVGTQLMVMMLVVGIGQSFLAELISLMSAEVVMKELAIILIATLVLYSRANKVPNMVSSIVTGHLHTGHVDQAGTGALLAGADTAAAFANQAVNSAITTTQSLSGRVMALQAAMKSSNTDNGSAASPSSVLGSSSNNSSGSQSLAAAMGDAVGSIGGSNPVSSSEASDSPQRQPVNGSTSNTSAKSNNASNSGSKSNESMGKALTKGIGELAKDKFAQTKQDIRENTFGGKLATTIANPGAIAQRRTGRETPDVKAEIAAFRDKKTQVG